MRDPRDVILQPIITEKSNDQMAHGQYSFWVARDANKTEIKHAVEQQFKVKVVAVNTMKQRGHLKRVGRFSGLTPQRKKAIVTLAEGQKIPFFEGM